VVSSARARHEARRGGPPLVEPCPTRFVTARNEGLKGGGVLSTECFLLTRESWLLA
jgi:hypothetical protein